MTGFQRVVWCGVVTLLVSSTSWGQFPFGASDTTYGLRSRIEENPSFTYTPSPEDWRDINIYQLFTDRFADGDGGNNPIGQGWYVDGRGFPENRNFHHGGDWKGLKDNLDYLSGMGVKAIWMSGVQMNAQGKDSNYTPYHMYHPTDFFRVDPVLGTFQDLKDLVDACHARGIYVILDVVINHTADKNGLRNGDDDKWYHPGGGSNFGWWNDGNKHAAPFDDLQWFHNNGTINNWDSHPEYIYGQFKGTDDLKTEASEVQGWLDLAFKNLIDATDCDGFRVDAIKHVEYNWCKQWADNIRKHAAYRGKNDFILFGEYFSYDNGTLASYCKDPGYSFNSALFFPMSQTFKSVFIDGNGTGNLTQRLNDKNQYGEGADRLVTFIDNHDVNRIGLQAGGDVGYINWVMRPALTFLYTGTPVPCLYYGTEQAFQQGGHWNGQNAGANYDDADWQRETMFDKGFQPGPAQGNKLAATDAPLYQHIAALNRARDAYKSLTRGSFQQRWDSGGRGPFAYSRVYQTEESLVAFNTSDDTVSISPQVGKPDGTVFVNVLYPEETVTVSGGAISFSLSGKDSKIFVAGLAVASKWARGTHNYPAEGEVTPATPIYVNTEAGPTSTVTGVNIGYTSDGSSWTVQAMTINTNWSSQGGNWYNYSLGSFSAGTTVRYFIEVVGDGDPVYDNNNGNDYTVLVEQGAGVWSRNTQSYPVDGDVTDLDHLFVNTEVGPAGTVTEVALGYSTNGTTWLVAPMTLNTNWGSDGGEWYNVDLGSFPASTTVRYYIESTDGITTNVDDNGGLYYQVSIRDIGEDLWIGNTGHSPMNGDITPATPVILSCESWPIGVATNIGVAYTVNGGATWETAAFAKVAETNNNDVWEINLGLFADGTIIQYAVFGQSTAKELWDNNDSQDYRAIVGEVGIRMVLHTPVLTGPGAPDNPEDAFDFNTTGGAATTSGDAGFGSFGSVYVNADETNLYIGATGVALPDDSANNAYMVLVSGGANVGSENLWSYDVDPQGLDELHNVAFQPPVNFAILLGDVYGDGTFFNFAMYDGVTGFDFGQGIFQLDPATSSITGVPDSVLSQFGGYGPGNRLAANWESSIPLSAFGVTNASSLTNLYLSGLMVTRDTTNNNRFISGRYLGETATLGNSELPDEFGNFAFSFVNLGGVRVLPPRATNTNLDVPDSWVTDKLPEGYTLTMTSDYDNDQILDRVEYFAGLDPMVVDDLEILEMAGGSMQIHKVGSQVVSYIPGYADAVVNGAWNWNELTPVTSLDGEIAIPVLQVSNAVMRVRIQVPPAAP
ncbi:MAG: hypothetical protein KDL31_00335 [Kiritimatiellae bacterium]|nr:hypothetical protein [Kiritimatiellia bacterium]